MGHPLSFVSQISKSNCEACKQTRAPCKKKKQNIKRDRQQREEHFGDIIAADHTILNEENEVVQDLATQ